MKGFRWTAPARERALELWKKGTRGGEIAEILLSEHGITVSKSSVIGIAFRAGLAFKGPGVRSGSEYGGPKGRPAPTDESRARDRERKRRRKAGLPPAPSLRAAHPPKPVSAPKPVPAVLVLPDSLRIPFTAVQAGQCRSIADDPRDGPATCCGHSAMSGSSWCRAHHDVCTVPARRPVSVWVPDRRRAA